MPTPLIMSISGTRGIIGDNLDPEIVMNMGKAVGSYVGKGPVVVGGDTRISHEMIKYAVISGLQSVGTDVIDIGKVPTPTVQQMIRHFNASAGMVITASHNPIEWNGVKLMNSSGSFFEEEENEEFQSFYQNKRFDLKAWDQTGDLTIVDNALELHIQKIIENIDITPIQNSKLKALIDVNHGTGALSDPILFEKLGIEYTLLNSAPDGRFSHEPEPLKKNLSHIMEELAKGDYDIGLVQDPDADRLVVLDENGRFIGEDYGFALSVDHVLSHEVQHEDNKQVVVNLSTSLVVNHVAEKHGASISYTKIGEPNVTKRLKELKAQVGGEGNGGVIYPKIGWGRDSLVGIVCVLKFLALTGKKCSEIVNSYPQYVIIRDKFEVSNRDEISTFLDKVESEFAGKEIDKQDGVKVMLENGWLHARPSNTEPIVRIFVEAPTESEAQKVLESVRVFA